MFNAQALVDYEKFRNAKVVIFIDISDSARTYEMMVKHRQAIDRLAALFSAEVLLVEGARLTPESIVEEEIADAWVLLVSDGRNRTMATRRNPLRINVDTDNDWERHAFREIVRQVKESTSILENVTAHYSRFRPAGRKPVEAPFHPGHN